MSPSELAQHPRIQNALFEKFRPEALMEVVLSVYRESLVTEDVMSAAIVAGLRAVGMSLVVVTHGDRVQMEAAAAILLAPHLQEIEKLKREREALQARVTELSLLISNAKKMLLLGQEPRIVHNSFAGVHPVEAP